MNERFCYGKFMSGQSMQCGDECPGPQYISRPGNGSDFDEGYLVQLCPNPANTGSATTTINFCGRGPDVLVFYQSKFPSEEQIQNSLLDL